MEDLVPISKVPKDIQNLLLKLTDNSGYYYILDIKQTNGHGHGFGSEDTNLTHLLMSDRPSVIDESIKSIFDWLSQHKKIYSIQYFDYQVYVMLASTISNTSTKIMKKKDRFQGFKHENLSTFEFQIIVSSEKNLSSTFYNLIDDMSSNEKVKSSFLNKFDWRDALLFYFIDEVDEKETDYEIFKTKKKNLDDFFRIK